MVHFNLNECLICHGAVSLGKEIEKKKISSHLLWHQTHEIKKKLKQRADESKEYHFYCSRTFNRTNSLIALLCTGTCTVCKTWHGLVSMQKFYTNFFFIHTESRFFTLKLSQYSEKVFRCFPSNCWCYCFTCMLYICELVFGGLLSIVHFDFMLFTINPKMANKRIRK